MFHIFILTSSNLITEIILTLNFQAISQVKNMILFSLEKDYLITITFSTPNIKPDISKSTKKYK